MQLSNQPNLTYKTDSVDTQVQILTDNFLLAQDSCAPFEVKIMKRPGAGCTKVLAVTLANGDRIHHDGLSKINLFLPIY